MLLCYWNRYIGWYLNVENLFRNNFVNIGSWALTSSRYRVLVDILMEVLKLAVTEDLICGNCSAAISRLLYQKACWYKEIEEIVLQLQRPFISKYVSILCEEGWRMSREVCAEMFLLSYLMCWILLESLVQPVGVFDHLALHVPGLCQMPHFWNSYVSFQ